MVALSVQTLLLMAAAYFLGAMAACLIRRGLFRPAMPEVAERRVDPLPDMAQRTVAPFGRSAAEDARSAKPAPPAAPPPSPAPVPSAAAAGETPAQDLKRIRLIDEALEAGLNKLGVRRYDQIAGWLHADVARVDHALGLKGRISQENWIEQAQVLAKGGETFYSMRRARGEGATALPTPDEGERAALPPAPPGKVAAAVEVKPQVTLQPRPATGGAAAVAADIIMPVTPVRAEAKPQPAHVAERAAFAEPRRSEATGAPASQPLPAATAGPEPTPAVPVRPVAPAARDNLQRIGGIDAQTEQRLSALGVTRYSQIAHWSPADVDRFDRQLAASGRIARENWVEQAQILSRGGDTAFSRDFDRRMRGEEPSAALRPAKLADAIREHAAAKAPDGRGANPDLGALRSVRSQAYQNPEPGPEAAQRAGAQNKVLRSAALEDLKRIRGIGVLIEKRLNSMGVVSYEQIANWSAADIERVSHLLDFKGRIERENWIEQARILASGGATEFSRRVDRGEVETSRLKT